MERGKAGLSNQAMRLAKSAKSVQLYTTRQAAAQISVRSMTLMRWIVTGKIRCPKAFLLNEKSLHWLWNRDDIREAIKHKRKLGRKSGVAPA